jgi:hypothetical protein
VFRIDRSGAPAGGLNVLTYGVGTLFEDAQHLYLSLSVTDKAATDCTCGCSSALYDATGLLTCIAGDGSTPQCGREAKPVGMGPPSGEGFAEVFGADAVFLYWKAGPYVGRNAKDGSVQQLLLGPTGSTNPFVPNAAVSPPYGTWDVVAMDDTFLYFTGYDGFNDAGRWTSALFRMNKDASGLTLLLQIESPSGDPTVTWIDASTDVIYYAVRVAGHCPATGVPAENSYIAWVGKDGSLPDAGTDGSALDPSAPETSVLESSAVDSSSEASE